MGQACELDEHDASQPMAGLPTVDRLTPRREISLAQLEALVLARRQERTRQMVQRLVAARCGLVDVAPVPVEQGAPVRSLESHGLRRLVSGELVPLPQAIEAQARRRAVRRNGVMLFAELALLLAFVIVLGLTFHRLQALNEEILRLRSGAPTPAVAVVTPTPMQYLPGERFAQQPSQVLAYTLEAPETPQPAVAERLVIPSINVDAVIVQGDDWASLKKGVGQHPGTPRPGEPGNLVLSAHDDVYGEIFRDLDKVKPGDEVLVYTEAGAFRYVVNSVTIVPPTAVEVMAPTDYAALTLITCYPYLVDTQRVVVVAELASTATE